MRRLLVENIGLLQGISAATSALRGAEMGKVESVADAYLVAEDGVIAAFGPMADCPGHAPFDSVADARGGIVRPAFCDSHTHIVYAGSREGEFIDKIKGLSYEEIAERGGGILNSADRLLAAGEDELFEAALRRMRLAAAHGTGAMDIKSGYGLTLEGELKMLRVIRRLKQAMPQMEIRANFLGAHAVGRAYKGRRSDYVNHVVADMLPAVVAEGLADYVDVFCDRGFFTVEDTEYILTAAAAFGLRGKIHANELDNSGGVQVGVAHGALSVDHLERVGEEELALLARSATVATMLPGCSFFSGMPYAPARRAIDCGCAVALASDWNPGSSPSGSMPFVMALGCIQMKMTPDEAFNACTLNGAAALGIADSFGSIAVGKAASLLLYDACVPSPDYIPYAYTEPLIDRVILKGEVM